MAPRGPALGLVGGDSACAIFASSTSFPSPHFLFGSLFPSRAPPYGPHSGRMLRKCSGSTPVDIMAALEASSHPSSSWLTPPSHTTHLPAVQSSAEEATASCPSGPWSPASPLAQAPDSLTSCCSQAGALYLNRNGSHIGRGEVVWRLSLALVPLFGLCPPCSSPLLP